MVLGGIIFPTLVYAVIHMGIPLTLYYAHMHKGPSMISVESNLAGVMARTAGAYRSLSGVMGHTAYVYRSMVTHSAREKFSQNNKSADICPFIQI